MNEQGTVCSMGAKAAESKQCDGCGEKRPAGKINGVAGEELCGHCQLVQLETEELRIMKEMASLSDNLIWAQEHVEEIETSLADARKRYNENEIRLAATVAEIEEEDGHE